MRFSQTPGGGVQVWDAVGSLLCHIPTDAGLCVPRRIVFPYRQMKTSVLVNSLVQLVSQRCPMEIRGFNLSSEKTWATRAAKGRSSSIRWPRWVDMVQSPSGSLTDRQSFVGSIFSSGASTVMTCILYPVSAMPSMYTSFTIFARGATVFEEI